MSQEYFDPEEIGRFLGLSAYTVRELCRKGQMRHVKMGRLIKIKKQWAEEYAAARTREPLESAA